MTDSGNADDNTSLDDNLLASVRSLVQQTSIPKQLEERIVRSLNDNGLLRQPVRAAWRIPLLVAIAAGIVCFATGLHVGSKNSMRVDSDTRAAPSLSSDTTRYMLLLYGNPSQDAAVDDVAEHHQWARDLVRAGHSVYGEKLDDAASLVTARSSNIEFAAPTGETIEGFFVISAKSAADALVIARNSPHVRHGGRVVVRRVSPT
jgi:hypothetical protein